MKQPTIYKSEAGKSSVMAFYDTLLHQLPVPCEQRSIHTRHGETHILISGDRSAPPLILLHGTGSNSAMWLGDIPLYARTHCVYAVDIIGDPGKSAETRPDLKGPAYAEWLEDVLDAFNLLQVSLVGCSFGGWISLKFATLHPERVDKLILLAPSGITQAKLSFLFRAMLLLCFGEWGIKRLNRIVYGALKVPEEADAFGTLIMKHFKPRYDALPIFNDSELQRLKMPLLLIAGREDALLHSEKTAARLKTLVPHCRADLRSGVGHVLLDVAEDVSEFLALESAEQLLMDTAEAAV